MSQPRLSEERRPQRLMQQREGQIQRRHFRRLLENPYNAPIPLLPLGVVIQLSLYHKVPTLPAARRRRSIHDLFLEQSSPVTNTSSCCHHSTTLYNAPIPLLPLGVVIQLSLCVIYELECQTCSQTYIGETGRMSEPECVRVVAAPDERAPAGDCYDMLAFSENNPSLKFKDRTTDSGDLKEVFSKFDATKKISSEILSRTRYLCAKYLGGAWNRLRLDQLRLKAITGGMSNLLFFVELDPEVVSIGKEARQALLRIQCQTDLDQLLTESVVFTLLSERSLGPKLLGVFPGGRFEQFIPSRPLQCREISKPAIGRLIAPMLARVHTLDVPIPKEPEVMTCARGWLSKFRQTAGGARPIHVRCTAARVPAQSYPESITCDQLEQELDFVEDFLVKSESPVVFSHNDLQEGNILLGEDFRIDDDGTIQPCVEGAVVMDPLVLIDFEYCSYNYRGFDLGNHFCEYGYDYNCDEPPYYKIYSEMFDVVHERRIFCAAYLDEVYKMRDTGDNPHFPSDLVTGDRAVDLDRLITESTLFMAVANIYWTCWALLNAEHSVIQFDYGSYARDRLALYYHQKKALQHFMGTH